MLCTFVTNALIMFVQNNCQPKHRQDVLRNGLKFENDRKFKNRLILKTILLMTVLVVVATCGFVAWSKLRSDENGSQPIKITTIIRKVSIDYDDLEAANVIERVVLPEIRTEFVPPSTPITSEPTRVARVARGVANPKEEIQWKWNSTGDYEEELEELVWVKVADKTKRNVVDKIEPRNMEKSSSFAPERSISHDIFWTAQGNSESIRQSQADRMLSFMDINADPCDDFYQYACGRWNEQNSIPEDRGGFDTFEMLRDNLEIVLRDLLIESNKSSLADGDAAVEKAKILYRSCMNEEAIEVIGNNPLLTLIDSLGGWPVLDPNWNETEFDWIEMTSNLRLYFNDMLLTFWIGQDLTSAINIIQFDQSSLGLPAREYFLKDQYLPYKEAYKTFFTQVAINLGADPITAQRDAEEVVNFETALANITCSLEERRNISNMYEKMTLGRLESEISHIDWRRYLTIVLDFEPADSEPVVIFSRKYFMLLGPLLKSTPPRTLANYIMWPFAKHRINNLSEKFQDIRQDFIHVLYGREKKPPRWSTCVQYVNGHLGMALGSLFVDRYFDESSKNNTVLMTQSIMDTFQDMLKGITWINGETRKLAQEKVKAITLRIGYPDFILDHKQLDVYFENVSITDGKHFENTLNVLQFSTLLERSRLKTVVNRTHWVTPPAIVNAYYSRNRNQIMFPAGILQPPFYHRHFPRSLNYGGIGVVIGHELIHGFDDKGRLYDTEGNLNRWWKEDEIQSFRSKTKCLIDQYNSYNVEEVDMKVDGVNTQGENIADNGGIKQAFRAYEKWIAKHGDADETLAGVNVTNYQLFFINFAQIWCGSWRPEAYRTKIQTGSHAPGRFRVIGTLSNSEEFAQIFNCPIDSYMNPKEKCRVW